MRKVGDIVALAESDRCYGVGTLTLRITDIGVDLARHPGLEWVRIHGVQLLPDGGEGEERSVLVRVTALRGHKLAP